MFYIMYVLHSARTHSTLLGTDGMDNFGDLWVFRGSESVLRWERLVAVGLPPCPRYGHQMLLLHENDDGNKCALYITLLVLFFVCVRFFDFIWSLCFRGVYLWRFVSLIRSNSQQFILYTLTFLKQQYCANSLGIEGPLLMVLGGCSVSPQGEMVGSNLAPCKIHPSVLLSYSVNCAQQH